MPQRAESRNVRCTYCNEEYRARGIAAHERTCRNWNFPDNPAAVQEADPLNDLIERNDYAGSFVAHLNYSNDINESSIFYFANRGKRNSCSHGCDASDSESASCEHPAAFGFRSECPIPR